MTRSVHDWPACADDVDAKWLNTTLSESLGEAVDATVSGSQRIGTGQVGECWRFELEHRDGGSQRSPSSVVAKFAASDPTSRAAGASQHCYRREVGFYRDLRPQVSINTPKCFFAAIDDDEVDHVLLLEDITSAAPGDQVAGCSPTQAEAALQQLALLHGPVWKAETLASCPWLEPPTDEYRAQVLGMFAAFAAPFLARFEQQVDQDSRDVVEWIAEHESQLVTQPTARTACHLDYRADNLLFSGTERAPEVTVVDWQTMKLGAGPQDVAYLLGGSLTVADRQRHEHDLVEAYHLALLDTGVRGYGFDQCWLDYRRSTVGGILMAVISAMLVGATDRGDVMFLAMLRRHARHFLDLKAKEVLL